MAYNTGNPIGSADARDIYDNAQNLDKAMNSTDPTWIDRFGVARPTFKGVESELNQKVGDAEAAATQARGYLNTMRATSYGPLTEDPTTDPLGNPCTAGDEYFNTTYNLLKRYDGSIWRVPDINTENLASGAGSSMVGHGGQTVEAALNERLLTADLASSAAGKGASLMAFMPSDTGAVATTVQEALQRTVSVFDFMTAAQIADVRSGTGSIDLTSVIQTAINSVYCTVSGYATGGANAGKCLVFPVGVYKIAGNLTIDQPVYLKGEGNGQATDSSQRTKFNFTGTGKLFTFTINSGFCLIEGLSLAGTKVGGVNIATGVYGNVAIEVGAGMGGTFRDVYFQGFDIGFLARERSGDSWGGAYRYLENCKFRNNTYSSAQLGLITDQHYVACDFRSNDSTGYVYIGTDLVPTDNYKNTFFTDCIFELLGDNSFLTRGLVIRGNAYVKAVNCYFEACAVFVDTGSQFVTNSYHRWQNGTSLRIGGGGFADISATSASSAIYALPDLSDTAYWTVSNLTDNGRNYLLDVLCAKYTVTNTTIPQILSTDFATYMTKSMQSVPENFNFMVVFLSFDYYTSEANVTVDLRVTAGSNGGSPSNLTPSISTYTDNTYYDSASGWKRKCYTLPFTNTVGGKPLAFLNPSFLLSGSGLTIGTVVGIRNVKMHIVTV